MSYEKTRVKPTSAKVEREFMFKNLSSGQIVWGAVRELYRRYDTEVYMIGTFSLFGYIIANKLGLL